MIFHSQEKFEHFHKIKKRTFSKSKAYKTMKSESRISDFRMIEDYDPFEEFDSTTMASNKHILTERFSK